MAKISLLNAIERRFYDKHGFLHCRAHQKHNCVGCFERAQRDVEHPIEEIPLEKDKNSAAGPLLAAILFSAVFTVLVFYGVLVYGG